ncbi:ATP-grasp domain-containing protein [Haliangium ochraceum]|uniref:ATP-grasp domain-containing protein n=1 Tax=Haliangium ochraceum (strain DSM 14365 / JCM 11303 / SMP-2) TaxID=502025 RepID=D0LM50_HALO1|nr:hypothetical protein [Haliangium ochraceum]ACY16756.1 conserved hypothetical protein [Haliangium ochraceum DSM 14365]
MSDLSGVDVVLAKCASFPDPDPDMPPLVDALRAAGLRCEVVVWDQPGVDWSQPRLVLLRATWDYFHKLEAFLAWLVHVSERTELWNSQPVAACFTHKRYLLEMQRRGLPVAPSELLERGSDRALGDIARDRGWDEMVIKPAVGGGSFRALRVGPEADSRAAGEAHLRALVAERDTLVQGFLPAVESYGERCAIFVDGELSHVVRKAPRFQDDQESVTPATLTAAETALAERAWAQAAAIGPTYYGRVDMVPDPSGAPVLMEMEFVEPSMFFRFGEAGLARLVDALVRRVRAPR